MFVFEILKRDWKYDFYRFWLSRLGHLVFLLETSFSYVAYQFCGLACTRWSTHKVRGCVNQCRITYIVSESKHYMYSKIWAMEAFTPMQKNVIKHALASLLKTYQYIIGKRLQLKRTFLFIWKYKVTKVIQSSPRTDWP